MVGGDPPPDIRSCGCRDQVLTTKTTKPVMHKGILQLTSDADSASRNQHQHLDPTKESCGIMTSGSTAKVLAEC